MGIVSKQHFSKTLEDLDKYSATTDTVDFDMKRYNSKDFFENHIFLCNTTSKYLHAG